MLLKAFIILLYYTSLLKLNKLNLVNKAQYDILLQYTDKGTILDLGSAITVQYGTILYFIRDSSLKLNIVQ